MNSFDPTPVVLANDLDEKHHRLYMESKHLSVDTETLGLSLQRDRLCVVQMCNENGITVLIQINQQSAPRLKEVLESPQVTKVFHFARFDLAMLKRWLDIDVAPVFCTKIASRLSRTYTDGHGLKNLVQELIGIELDKMQQSSDWAAEILSPMQIKYAATDVVHLIYIKERLEEMLKRENRMELALECMQFLPARVRLDLAGFEDDDIFAHH